MRTQSKLGYSDGIHSMVRKALFGADRLYYWSIRIGLTALLLDVADAGQWNSSLRSRTLTPCANLDRNAAQWARAAGALAMTVQTAEFESANRRLLSKYR